MSAESRIDELSERLGKTVERIESLQKGKNLTFGARVRQHFSKHGTFITNAMLAGCVFFVAVGRLHQKSEFQVERDEWDEQKRRLHQENYRLLQELQSQQEDLLRLRQGITAELGTGGWRLAPVAGRLRQLLDSISLDEQDLSAQDSKASQSEGEKRSEKNLTIFRPAEDAHHYASLFFLTNT